MPGIKDIFSMFQKIRRWDFSWPAKYEQLINEVLKTKARKPDEPSFHTVYKASFCVTSYIEVFSVTSSYSFSPFSVTIYCQWTRPLAPPPAAYDEVALSTHTVVVGGNELMGFIGFLETYKEKASSVLLFTLASLLHLYLPQAERLFGQGENRAH